MVGFILFLSLAEISYIIQTPELFKKKNDERIKFLQIGVGFDFEPRFLRIY